MAKLIAIAIARNFTTLVFFVVILSCSVTNAAYNVVKLGAKPDGKTDSTGPFLKAWASACNSVKPAVINVPSGQYYIKQAVFSGPCRNNNIVFKIRGTLIAPSDYRTLANTGTWISFNKVTGVSVIGGTLDGRGAGFWDCKNRGQNCPDGARSLAINNAVNVVISGLTSINSERIHVGINRCTNVIVRGVNIIAPGQSPNTDGIHVESSTGVTILNSKIKTGDDCISIGPGTRKLLVDGVQCGPGHGISIGSLGKDYNEDGVQDVTVRNSVFTGSDNGLRIKSWARPSNGFVRNVLYQNIVMSNVKNPIIIDQRYCPSNQGCPNQQSGIKINGVTYQDVRGTSATPVAVKLDCSGSNPCGGIKMLNVKITYMNQPAQSSCSNAQGTSNGLVVRGSCL